MKEDFVVPKKPKIVRTGGMPNPTVGLKVAVQLFQVAEQTVRKWADDGEFPSTRDPGTNVRQFLFKI